jgi:hypothetical protein
LGNLFDGLSGINRQSIYTKIYNGITVFATVFADCSRVYCCTEDLVGERGGCVNGGELSSPSFALSRNLNDFVGGALGGGGKKSIVLVVHLFKMLKIIAE